MRSWLLIYPHIPGGYGMGSRVTGLTTRFGSVDARSETIEPAGARPRPQENKGHDVLPRTSSANKGGVCLTNAPPKGYMMRCITMHV